MVGEAERLLQQVVILYPGGFDSRRSPGTDMKQFLNKVVDNSSSVC